MGWGEPCTCRWRWVLPTKEVGCVAEYLERVLASFLRLEGLGKPLRRIKMGHGELPEAGWERVGTHAILWVPPWIWHQKNFTHFHPVKINDKDFHLDRNWEVLEEELAHPGRFQKHYRKNSLVITAPPPATSSSPLLKNYFSFGVPGLEYGLR